MKERFFALLTGILTPFAATMASNEGVPTYYQRANANQASYNQYATQGYTPYVGQSGNKQIVGTRSYTYQTPRNAAPTTPGAMTTNGIALPATDENKTVLSVDYSRRFADFEFTTGVNSVLEWDDMVFNEINVGAQHNFSLRNFDLFAYAQFGYGKLSHGGLSMDYDLEPYDWSEPYYGIFTISIGEQSGTTNHMKFGLGAHHIWDIWGWKLSPSIGYEIFKHDLKMSNHYYPNPGVYLPLMTSGGDYVFGDENGNYYAAPIDAPAIPDNWYQVCMSPEDIKVVPADTSGYWEFGDSLTTVDWNSAMGDLPWGVEQNECVIIGGDGPIIVEGTTHIYNTTWSGFYIGLEIEKQVTLADKLRFYFQVGMPKYSSEGIWPNRDDWQQNPSFLDEGSNGAFSYTAEMEYNLKLSNRLQLALKVDTNMFQVGKIGGELYVAEYSQFQMDANGQYVYQEVLNADGQTVLVPVLETVPAHTEYISDQLKKATWQSFGLHLGIKYAF